MPTVMTDEQRKAMFARLRSGSGSSGNTRSPYSQRDLDAEQEEAYRADAARVFQGKKPLNQWKDRTPEEFAAGIRLLDARKEELRAMEESRAKHRPYSWRELDAEQEEAYRIDAERVQRGLKPFNEWADKTPAEFAEGVKLLDTRAQIREALEAPYRTNPVRAPAGSERLIGNLPTDLENLEHGIMNLGLL